MSAARPETGATDDQIEAAARAIFDQQNRRNHWDSTWDDHAGSDSPFNRQVECRAQAREALAVVVPPTHVIALAEHVVSAADREAIGLSLDVLDCIDRWRMTPVADRDADATLGIMADKLTPEHRERLIRLAATSATLERLHGSGGEDVL